MGVRKLTLYGPEGLAYYVETLQLFIYRYDYFLRIKCRPDYEISVIEIEDDIEEIELKEGVIIRPYVLHTHHDSPTFTRIERHISGSTSKPFYLRYRNDQPDN